MKYKTTYELGATVAAYRENGFSFGQIAETLFTTKARVSAAFYDFQKKQKREETFETVSETPRNGTIEQVEKVEENSITGVENAVSPVSPAAQNVSVSRQFTAQFAQTFHPADLIAYVGVLIACFGVSQTLPGIGIVVSVLYFAVFTMAQHRLKTHGRWFDIALMALVELAVGFPAHLAWANNALWANVTKLPIEIQLAYGGQMWVGRGIETPFKAACYIACVLVLFGAYGVLVSVLANKEKTHLKT